MPDLLLKMDAEENVSPAMAKAADATKQLGTDTEIATEKAGTSWAKYGDAVKTGLLVAGGALAAFSKMALEDFASQEKADKMLGASMEQLGLNSKELVEVFKGQATALQETLGVSDDMVEGLQAMAIRFGTAPSQVDALTRAVLDFAAATGKDADGAMQVLLKGVENGGDALKKLGVHYETTGDKAEDLNRAVEAIEKRFGGSAAAASDTFAGQLAKMREQAHELNETFGGFLVNLNAHTGTLDKVTTAFKEWNFVLSGGDKDLDARNERMNTLSMTTRLLTEERGRLKELDNADLAFQQNKGPTEMARLKAATQANIDLLVAQKAVAQQAIDAANGKASAPGPIGPTFGPSEPTEEWKKKAEEADKKAKEAAAKAAEARAKAMKAAQDDAVKGMEQQAKLDATAAEKAQKENDDFNAAMLGSQAKFDQDKYAAEYAAERKLTAMEAREDEARIKQDAQNNAQRVEAAKMAGAAVGASFITAMGNAIHQTNSGEDMDPGEFIKSLLPSLVGFGLEAAGFGPAGMMLGQAMTGAVMQQFATGGYVQPEHHAGGGYGGEGDTVPAMLTPGERILSLPEIGAMGGRDAVERAVSGGGGGGPTIINQISAMDTQSFQSYMGDRGGAGLVRAVRQNRGETAQMLRRAGAR